MSQESRKPNEAGQKDRSSIGQTSDSSNPSQATSQPHQGDDAYRRDGAHLGSSVESPQKGGGGTGYDVDREQEQINKEQEEMHKERDQDQIDIERTQNPQPEINPGKEEPGGSPSPETRPGTSTMGNYTGGIRDGWNQSSWDPQSFR